MALLALSLIGCATPKNPLGLPTDGGGPREDGGFPIDHGDGGTSTDGGGGRCGDGICNAGETCQSCPADCTCNCPAGFGDCDGNLQNGCETNLNTSANCGACGKSCAQTGGSNACVLVGASYVCQPTCDATHADCDQNPANGCEADLTSTASCGACGVACANPHGQAACTSGACAPTCDSGWSVCGKPADGCATQTGSDPDHCGGCTRACSALNTSTRACVTGLCKPTCAAPWSDCSDPAAPGADDGCETNGTADPGENDNACAGQPFTVGEGGSTTLTTNRILPLGDTDTFAIYFKEGSSFCFPGTSQSYGAKVTLTSPSGVTLKLSYKQDSCDNTWSSIGNAICYNWGGTCAADDSKNYYVQVSGAGVSSCGYYTLKIEYASRGNKPSGC